MSNDLHAVLEKRRIELQKEFDAGQSQIAALEARLSELRNTLLRISGAIQVIDEALSTDGKE